MYKSDNSIIKIEGNTKTTFKDNGYYSIYKNFNKETSKIPFYETVNENGERLLTYLFKKEEPTDGENVEDDTQPDALPSYKISTEIDAESGAECITRDDNTLIVKY